MDDPLATLEFNLITFAFRSRLKFKFRTNNRRKVSSSRAKKLSSAKCKSRLNVKVTRQKFHRKRLSRRRQQRQRLVRRALRSRSWLPMPRANLSTRFWWKKRWRATMRSALWVPRSPSSSRTFSASSWPWVTCQKRFNQPWMRLQSSWRRWFQRQSASSRRPSQRWKSKKQQWQAKVISSDSFPNRKCKQISRTSIDSHSSARWRINRDDGWDYDWSGTNYRDGARGADEYNWDRWSLNSLIEGGHWRLRSVPGQVPRTVGEKAWESKKRWVWL